MVTSVANQQIPAVNAFKPAPSTAEQLVTQKDKFDDAPKNGVEELNARNTDRRTELASARDITPAYSAEGSSGGSGSSRGGNLDISI